MGGADWSSALSGKVIDALIDALQCLLCLVVIADLPHRHLGPREELLW